MTAVIILLQVLAKNVLHVIAATLHGHQIFNRSFIILGLREGLTPFNKKNSSNLSGEKKECNEAFWGICF